MRDTRPRKRGSSQASVVVDGSRAGGQTATDDQGSVAGGAGMDQARVEALAAAERKWFRDGRPRSMEATSRATGTMPRGVPMSWMDELYDHPPLWVSHGAGSRFWDLDGHEYVDMYVADMSAFCGHAAAPVVRAVLSDPAVLHRGADGHHVTRRLGPAERHEQPVCPGLRQGRHPRCGRHRELCGADRSAVLLQQRHLQHRTDALHPRRLPAGPRPAAEGRAGRRSRRWV